MIAFPIFRVGITRTMQGNGCFAESMRFLRRKPRTHSVRNFDSRGLGYLLRQTQPQESVGTGAFLDGGAATPRARMTRSF